MLARGDDIVIFYGVVVRDRVGVTVPAQINGVKVSSDVDIKGVTIIRLSRDDIDIHFALEICIPR